MSIFSGCTSYAGKWSVKYVESMPKEDIEAVDSVTVVNSQYGLSACFLMKAGNIFYIPMEQGTTASAGDALNVEELKVVTLEKQGEADIQRIRV